ncbi:MAG: hypothetical protein FJ088_10275, partial [Deltaproteobacteria bacterium]|nr:hypothetical protein [Deltaproteobacteria bacterium]
MPYKVKTFSAILVLLFASCKEKEEFPFLTGMRGFHISIEESLGDPENPLPFSATPAEFTIKIKAYSYEDAESFAGFNGWVRVSSKPGTLSLIGAPAGPEVNTVLIKNGASDPIKVKIANAFGNTFIWAGSLGYEFTPENATPACSDDADNDSDGVTDFPFDLGCSSPSDNTEKEDDHYYGLSPTIYFKTPSISDIQQKQSKSPLAGSYVTVIEGNMIVTRITAEGFYVTDIGDQGGYNHIYAFTFNTPENLMVCDRVTKLSGIVLEFYGFTEMTAPSFVNEFWDDKKDKCPVPAPILLSAADVGDNAKLEGFESALVQLKDVRLGSKFTNCDFNGDGDVDWRDFNTNECSAECQCGEACQKDPLCTELTQFNLYGQFAVALDDGAGPKIFVLTKGS